MSEDDTRLAEVLTPCAPPRIIDGVYRDGEFERMLDVVKREGPWPTIVSHHLQSVDELIATVTGVVPPDHGLTLDDLSGPHFRGFFAQNSVSFYPELHDIFYNDRFLDIIKDYWGCEYAKPTMMLFNICGPHESGRDAHLDAVTFRGIRIENSPVWLQNVMGRSGLFTDHLVKMAQVIAWWYRGEHGTFTYWPDGPLGEPKRLDHPLWNRGVVVQNEMMFHRGDPVGRPDERDTPGLKHRSRIGYEHDRDEWAITTDGEVMRRYRPEEMRLLVHWSAEVYSDMAEVEKNLDHSDALTHDMVFERLLADMHKRGVAIADPSDPLHDPTFIRALISTYSIAPATDWARQSVA